MLRERWERVMTLRRGKEGCKMTFDGKSLVKKKNKERKQRAEILLLLAFKKKSKAEISAPLGSQLD